METLRDRFSGVADALTRDTAGGWAAAVLAVVVLFGVLNVRLIFGLDAVVWDADRQYAPAYGLVADHARAGRFMLWNPWIAGGYPEGADPQIGAFSPLTVGLGLLTGGSERGFRIYFLCIWLLGGLGMLWFARHLRAPPWGGFVVGMGLLYCGFYTGHAEHTAWVYTFSFIPWMLWRVDVGLSTGRLRPCAEAGALWGLSALAGYPAYVFYGFGLCGLWSAGRWIFCARSRRVSFARLLLLGAVATTVGFVVLSPALAAFVGESRDFSDRSGPLPREVAVKDNALDPEAVVTVVSPYLSVVKLWNPDRWPSTDISHTSLYPGTLVLVLAAIGLVLSRTDRFRWFLAIVGVGFLLTALDGLPIRGWFYDLLPPMRYSRHAAQLKDFALLIAAILAAQGSGDLAHRWRPSRAVLGVVAALAGIAITLVSSDLAQLANPGPHPMIAVIQVVGLWGGLVGVVIAATGAARVARWLPLAVIALSVFDAGATAWLCRPVMFDRGEVRHRWDRLNADHVPELDLVKAGWARFMEAPGAAVGVPANWNVPLRRPTLDGYLALTNRSMDLLTADERLAAPALGSTRAWFAARATEVAPGPSVATALAAAANANGSPPLVVHRGAVRETADAAFQSSELGLRLSSLPPVMPMEWKLVRYHPGELVFEVEAPSAGWLLVTDRWSRGWTALVDGLDAQLWTGHLVFRALHVAAGPHLVEMRFRPLGYPWLLVVSWALLAGIALGAIVATRRRHPV